MNMLNLELCFWVYKQYGNYNWKNIALFNFVHNIMNISNLINIFIYSFGYLDIFKSYEYHVKVSFLQNYMYKTCMPIYICFPRKKTFKIVIVSIFRFI